MNVLDLFSGIGGFSLGLERAGFKTVAFCEIDPFCQKVLKKHWPDVPIYDDIRTLPKIECDVICGGFPCQDISVAGRGAGLAGERSGLWRDMARAIGISRPRWVIVENVAALLGRGLDTVLADLAALGFDAEWRRVSAREVGLPHDRGRIVIVSNAHGLRKLQPNWRFADQRGRLLDRFSEAAWPLPNGGGSRSRHGLSQRMDVLGNAFPPQIPELIGRAIMRAEHG